MPHKLTIEEVNGLDREQFVRRFGVVYEHSPWVAAEAWRARPFGGLAELHAAMQRAVRDAPDERRLALVRAHPDLAGKAAMSDESTREQSSAGLDRLSAEEYERFTRTNAEYREKFGLPFVVCVREHAGKESILADAEVRLGNSREEELETALEEVSKIARLRLQDLVEPDAAGQGGTR